jgi:hypothetical protein
MMPGIHPNNVNTMLSTKLARRPVMSTATGGSTTQKKYRNAFIPSSCVLRAAPYARDFRNESSLLTFAIRNVRSRELNKESRFRSEALF